MVPFGDGIPTSSRRGGCQVPDVEEQPEVRLGVLSQRAPVSGQVRHHGDPCLLRDVGIGIQVANHGHLLPVRATGRMRQRPTG